MQQTQTDFIKSKLFETLMSNKGFDSWSNYSGPDFSGWLCALAYTRDSGVLEQSNFDAALERLGGESKHVQVRDVGHWACGWFKQIMVNSKAKSKVKILQSIYKDLEEYPILDELDYNERENEYQSNFANDYKHSVAKALSIHFGVKNTRALVNIAYELNMECQRYYGEDSCIDIYDMRKPSKCDIERLQTSLDQMKYNYSKSRVYTKLVEAVKAYRV